MKLSNGVVIGYRIIIICCLAMGVALFCNMSAYSIVKPTAIAKETLSETAMDQVWSDKLGTRLANFESDAYKKKNVSYQGGYEGQCTWYCVGRAYETTGKLITVAPNAKKWLSIKLPKGASVEKDSDKIQAQAIAVSTSGKYGHVMFVEAVVGDWVYYTEANVPMDHKLNDEDGLLKRQSLDKFKKRVAGYIYLNE